MLLRVRTPSPVLQLADLLKQRLQVTILDLVLQTRYQRLGLIRTFTA